VDFTGNDLWPPQGSLSSEPDRPRRTIDTTVPHSARIWNYWLGGKDNYAADREMGALIEKLLPSIVAQAREDRAFLRRAVRHLTGHGIRQFLDIGTGLPTADNTHEVAQREAPDSRVVYVDNDTMVLVHANAILASTDPAGICAYIYGDLHEPTKIVADAAATLDFDKPIALLLLGVVHHVTDTDTSYAVVEALVDALPAGSFVVLNHATNAVHGATSDAAVAAWNLRGKPPITLRSPDQIARYFDGLTLLEPGVVSCSRWRNEDQFPGPVVDEFCGVAAK
jgi:hypothetical protein